MAVHYCEKCRSAYLPNQCELINDAFYCPSCHIDTINLGAEDARVSISGHLHAKDGHSPVPDGQVMQSPKSYVQSSVHTAWLECTAILEENPLNLQALYTLSQYYFSQGLLNESIAIASQILSIDPTFKPAQMFLSKYSTSSIQTPTVTNVTDLEQIAIVHINNGTINEAVPILTQILSINPNHAPSHRYLAEYHTRSNNYKSAIYHLNILTLLYPNDAHVYYNLAVCCYEFGDDLRAKSSLKEANRLCKPDSSLAQSIATFEQHLNRSSDPY